MKGFITNIDNESMTNTNYREVLYTAPYSQLVVMSLMPDEEIGEETHGLDQFIHCGQGVGKVVLDGVENEMEPGIAVMVPSGIKHNIINTSSSDTMKLYTLYAPPNHPKGTIHKTKADAEADDEEGEETNDDDEYASEEE